MTFFLVILFLVNFTGIEFFLAIVLFCGYGRFADEDVIVGPLPLKCPILSGILMNMTIADKLIYIPNDEQQNYVD